MAKVFNADMIAKSYQDRFGGTEAHAKLVVYFFQELIQQELYRGYPINLSMIGKFHPVIKKPRKARNPKTGVSVEVPAKYSVKFKPSHKLKIWLNRNR